MSPVDRALAEVRAAYPGENGKNHTSRILADEVVRLRSDLEEARDIVSVFVLSHPCNSKKTSGRAESEVSRQNIERAEKFLEQRRR